MAWRPSDLVEAGELDNTVRGKVTGWIQLRGRDEPIELDLRGDCHPDLAGWRFRIVRVDPVPNWAEHVDLERFATAQVGTAGDITADQVLRHYDCPVDELLARTRAGEPPPTELRKALYLEWYSDLNGRVVIQDTRLGVERMGERAFEISEEELRQQAEEDQRQMDELRSQGLVEDFGPGITLIHNPDADGHDLQSHLDGQTREIDQAIQQSLEDKEFEQEDPHSGDDP